MTILSDCQQIVIVNRVIINNYILGLLWGSHCFFLFISHRKDEIGRMSATSTSVLLKSDSLQSLENCIKSVYYSNYSMTLYFQVPFLKLKCTENAKNLIKIALKSERKKNVSSLKKKYQGPEKKIQEAKERYRDPEPIRQYRKRKYQEKKRNIRKILSQRKNLKKRNIRKILNQKENMKKATMWKIPIEKDNIKKTNMRKILNQKKRYEKNKYDKNPEPKKDNHKKVHKKNKKCLNKVTKFCQQIRQSLFHLYSVSSMPFKHSVRLFEHDKYILTAEFYSPIKLFDQKIYICNGCHKHLSRNEMPCQAAFNKKSLNPIPDELKDLNKSGKILIPRRIIFKKIAIMHGKGEFAKIKGSIIN